MSGKRRRRTTGKENGKTTSASPFRPPGNASICGGGEEQRHE